jgi:hypothetical protein
VRLRLQVYKKPSVRKSAGVDKSSRAHQITPAESICEIKDFFPVFRVPAGRGGLHKWFIMNRESES